MKNCATDVPNPCIMKKKLILIIYRCCSTDVNKASILHVRRESVNVFQHTFGNMHWPLPMVFGPTKGDTELTENPRLEPLDECEQCQQEDILPFRTHPRAHTLCHPCCRKRAQRRQTWCWLVSSCVLLVPVQTPERERCRLHLKLNFVEKNIDQTSDHYHRT